MELTRKSPRLYWACQILGWSVYFGEYILYGLSSGISWSPTFWAALPNTVFGLGATHLYREWIRAHRWTRKPVPQLALRVAAAVLIITSLWNVFEMSLFSTSGIWDVVTLLTNRPGHSLLVNVFYLDFCSDALYIGMWSAIYFGWHYLDDYHAERFEKLRVQADLREAELEALRSQLNPHFLFNSLNSIRSLITESPEKARDMVTHLSSTLRYALASAGQRMVTLEEELQIVSDYLAIERARFEDRLAVAVDTDPAALPLPVPPMIVQTLVENAVKHGVAKREKGGGIGILSRVEGATLVVEVTNDGVLGESRLSQGTGLRNAVRRLEALYGPDATLALVDSGREQVRARLTIPLEGNGHESPGRR